MTSPKLSEPRHLFSLQRELGPQQAPRWPAECQVNLFEIDIARSHRLPSFFLKMALETQRHIEKCPVEREPYYQTTGTEPEPPPWGEEILNNGDQLIYNYVPHHSVPYVILNSLFIFYQVRRYKFYLLNLSLLDPAQQTFYHGWKKVIDLQHFRMN